MPVGPGGGPDYPDDWEPKRPLTQRDFDIREIECAVDLLKRGRRVIWSGVREAIDRLERP